MKTLRLMFLAVLTTAFLYSCTKEGPEGPKGDKGDKGDTGLTGATGPQGVAGNANVKLYNYGTKTFTTNATYVMTNMPKARIDSCFVLAYYEHSSLWYPVPGIGANNAYEIRNYWGQASANYNMFVRLYKLDGTSYTTEETWTKFKIYVVAPSVIFNVTKKSSVDLSNPDFLDEYLKLQKE